MAVAEVPTRALSRKTTVPVQLKGSRQAPPGTGVPPRASTCIATCMPLAAAPSTVGAASLSLLQPLASLKACSVS